MLRFAKLEELPDEAIDCAKIIIKCRNNWECDTSRYINAEESFYDAVMDIFETANKNINLATCNQDVFDQISINREELISKIERMCKDGGA